MKTENGNQIVANQRGEFVQSGETNLSGGTGRAATSSAAQSGATNYPGRSFTNACRKLVQGLISKVRSKVVAEFRGRVQEQDELLQRALSEAEALAWESGYPQLFFPTLALEKAQAVANWRTHQRAVLLRSPQLALAA